MQKSESDRNIEEPTKKTTCEIYGIVNRATSKLKNLLEDESWTDTANVNPQTTLRRFQVGSLGSSSTSINENQSATSRERSANVACKNFIDYPFEKD